MKNLPFLTALLFLGFLTSCVWGADSMPEWILNHGSDAQQAVLGQGDLTQELGLTRIQPTGTDLTLTFPMTKEDAFPAAEFPFFAMRYRMTTRLKQSGIFFTTETLTELSDKSYSPFPISGDGQWHHAVMDLRTCAHKNWAGTVTSFRLDPTNPSDTESKIEISRLGFFSSEAAAQTFLEAANDQPDYSQETVLRGEGFQCLIPANTLSDGWQKTDFLLTRTNRSPEVLQALRDGAALTVCRNGSPIPCRVNSRGFAWYAAEQPGSYSLECVEDPKTGKRMVPIPLDSELQKRLGCEPPSASALPAEHFSRERIRLGAWAHFNPQHFGAACLRDYRDCGFDLLIGSGTESSTRNRSILFQECDALGIEVFVHDGAWIHPETAGEEYFDHPSFGGHYFTDEPGSDAYEKLGKQCEAYHAATGKTPYVNLLPLYANAAQLKFGAGAAAIEYYDADPELYRKYCERYCDLVPTDFICTDIYPLNWRNGKRVTYQNYVESINVIATVARERNREFWCCIQTFGWIPSKRTPNASEFRWQCWSLLSFGCRGILCWVYAGLNPETPSLLTSEGEKTPAWFDAQTVLREIQAVSDVFCRFRNVGAFTHHASDAVPYLKMSGEYRNFRTIQELNCPDPLLIGCFEAREKKNENESRGTAFTLVNMTELEAAQSTIARLKLDVPDGQAVTVYRRGVPQCGQTDSDGFYVIPLETGEGVFVTVAPANPAKNSNVR